MIRRMKRTNDPGDQTEENSSFGRVFGACSTAFKTRDHDGLREAFHPDASVALHDRRTHDLLELAPLDFFTRLYREIGVAEFQGPSLVNRVFFSIRRSHQHGCPLGSSQEGFLLYKPQLKGVTMPRPAHSLFSFLGLALTCASVQAQQVLTVPIDHQSIQSAVDALPAGGPMNTIQVAPGQYQENLVISGRNVLFVGDPGKPYSVVLDGTSSGSVASALDGAYVAFSGLTFQNGLGTTYSGSSRGGGLFAEAGTTLLMADCLIRSNEAEIGGGLYASGAERVELNRVGLSDNQAKYTGGGALIFGPFQIRDSEFNSNSSSAGGHLTCSVTSSELRLLESCAFIDGTVHRGPHLAALDEAAGGAIHASISQGNALVVTDCEFVTCTSDDVGGAIACRQPVEELRQRCLAGTYVCGQGSLQMTGCSFEGCVAPRGGAIAWSYDGGLELEQCAFEGCFALTGGAIHADSGAHRILDSTFATCGSLGQPGGALRFESCEADLLESEFTECGAGNSSGGAISAYESVLSTNTCRFTGNAARAGSAINAHRSALLDQGSVFEENSSAYAVALECEDQLWGSEFIGSEFRNHGLDPDLEPYGAVRMSFNGPADGPQPKGRFVGCTFASNRSASGAAAIESAGVWVEVKTSTFTDNGALSSEGAGGSGGAINLRDARADIWTAQFADNHAEGPGGAIAAANAQLSVWECDFSENASASYGGAIESYEGTILSVTDSRFVSSIDEPGPMEAFNASMGGAIDIAPDSGRAYLGGLRIEGHAAFEQGGGVWSRGSQTVIEECLITGNHCAFGGGAYLDAGSTIQGSRVCGNDSDQLNGHQDWVDGGGNAVSATCCPTDLDGNGFTDAGDLTILLASFGTQGSSTLLVDLNGDQRVDGADLSVLLAQWGSPCDS